MQQQNGEQPICSDGLDHRNSDMPSAPADGSSLHSTQSCLFSAAHRAPSQTTDQISSILKAHDYIGLSEEVTSRSLRTEECMEEEEENAMPKDLNLILRLGPPKPVRDGEDGFYVLNLSSENTGSEVMEGAGSDIKLGSSMISEEISHGSGVVADELDLNIGLSCKSSEVIQLVLLQRFDPELEVAKPSSSRALTGDNSMPKNTVTGAKRVFSEVIGDGSVMANGAAKIPTSTIINSSGTEARLKHHPLSSALAWSSAADASASWKIGVEKPFRPEAFSNLLLSPRQVFMKSDIRDICREYGSRILPKMPSVPESEPGCDVQDAKATQDNAAIDTTPRAPVGWPPVQSFRKNSLPPPKPKIHAETKVETVVAAPLPNPKVHAQVDCLFVKVYMDGLSIGRKVDLRTYDSYEELSLALEEMFKRFSSGQVCNQGHAMGDKEVTVKGKKLNFFSGSDYVLTYEDKDGDLMLVGDVPWGMFMSTVKRLRIMKGSEAIGLAPRSDKARCE